MYAGLHLEKLAEFAFPIFLSPLLLPFPLLIENPLQGSIVVATYVAVGCAVWVMMQRQGNRMIEIPFSDADAERGTIALNYFSAVASQPQPLVVRIALIFGVVTLICESAILGAAASEHFPPKIFIYLLPIPSLIALISGVLGCFVTESGTAYRKKALFALCVGLFVGVLRLFVIYLIMTGLDKYG
jgi:hypothetical protein